MGSTVAIGRRGVKTRAFDKFGVKTRAFDKFGETVATFLGSESLGSALAFESKEKS